MKRKYYIVVRNATKRIPLGNFTSEGVFLRTLERRYPMGTFQIGRNKVTVQVYSTLTNRVETIKYTWKRCPIS